MGMGIKCLVFLPAITLLLDDQVGVLAVRTLPDSFTQSGWSFTDTTDE